MAAVAKTQTTKTQITALISDLHSEAAGHDELCKSARWSGDETTAQYYDGLATGLRSAIVKINRNLGV